MSDRISDDEIDIQPWPVIEQVGRAVTLATVARRGFLEVADDEDQFTLETDRFDLVNWARTELGAWISDAELAILSASIGDLSDDDLAVCDDALIAATTIAWALRAVGADQDRLPLPDHDALNEATLKWAPEPWNNVRPLANRARLRDDAALGSERERWELWYWRSTTADISDSDLQETVGEAQESGFRTLAKGDLANDDYVAYHDMSPEDQEDVAWLSEIRLRTLNWVCGFGETWGSAPIYLD